MNTKGKYVFYSIYDRSKEWIDKKEFNSYMEALETFSSQKHLTPTQFLKIYRIIKIDDQQK